LNQFYRSRYVSSAAGQLSGTNQLPGASQSGSRELRDKSSTITSSLLFLLFIYLVFFSKKEQFSNKEFFFVFYQLQFQEVKQMEERVDLKIKAKIFFKGFFSLFSFPPMIMNQY